MVSYEEKENRGKCRRKIYVLAEAWSIAPGFGPPFETGQRLAKQLRR